MAARHSRLDLAVPSNHFSFHFPANPSGLRMAFFLDNLAPDQQNPSGKRKFQSN
jgi:hypothetical protein